jgi:hypothetical protein
METRFLLILLIGVLILLLIFKEAGDELFTIPMKESSAWDWNVGTGYGAGYGTGYGRWGAWPASLPRLPWKNWMWGRRPLNFVTPYTPVPQIDYNNTNKSNYNVSLLPVNGGSGVRLAIDGMAGRTLQLDRNRPYYFHVHTPGTKFLITNIEGAVAGPVEQGTLKIIFDQNDPDQLYYTMPEVPNSGGMIYLNTLRADD